MTLIDVLLKVVVPVASLTVAIIATYVAWVRGRPRLRVRARVFPFRYPPAVEDALKVGADMLDLRTVGKPPPAAIPADVNELLNRFAWLDTVKLAPSHGPLTWYWEIQVTNLGQNSVEGADLVVPGAVAGLIHVRTEGKSHPRGDTITLPALRPTESIHLQVWSRGDTSPPKPTLLLVTGTAKASVHVSLGR